MTRIVIAGGGLAAQRCAETLRALGHDGPLTMLAAEPHAPYDRPRDARAPAATDEHACLAHGDCAHVAPAVFAVAGVAEVVGTGPDELLRAAARACPAGAIVLIDADTGEEVEP